MANKDPYGMAIRLPNDMVEMLKKLRDEQNLPSMATAVKFWVEQQATERREEELSRLKTEIHNLVEAVTAWQAMTIKAHWKANFLVQKMEDGLVVDKEGEERSLSELFQIIDETPLDRVLERGEKKNKKVRP